MVVDPDRAKALFLRASDIVDPAERAAYLDRECGGDAKLRGRVEALLKAHGEGEGDRSGSDFEATFISGDAPAGVDEGGNQGAKQAVTQTPLPPELIATKNYAPQVEPGLIIAERYTLVEKIGEGGMGEVWLAKQNEPVKRKVALKLIKAGMDSKSVLQRFEQERQALAMMDHPNIARVLDGGLTPTGQPFFVMELVNGLPLNKFCDELKLAPRQRLELFVPICQAVQHAHQKGIVHRDLKPANILITMIDGKPVPKVIDFGVAKATVGKLTDETMSTQFGAVVGTLEYMSPEQAGFAGEDVDTRADIYSLGVILYESLTGLKPIDAKRLRKGALIELIRMIREDEPSKPSTRLSTDESLPTLAALRQTEPKQLTALLRGELDWVVMKCLEKQRDRRYETANALARDIQRYLADEALEARPPSTAYRFQKFVRRNRVMVTAGAAVAAALLLGLTLAIVGFVQAKADREIADQARIDAQAQKKIADNQRQLAVENAKQADANAKDAKLQLAHGLIAQADAFGLAKRYSESHRLYGEAYDKFVELKQPRLTAEIGLWSSYHQAPHPLLNLTGHTLSVFSLAISPDGRTALSGSEDKTLKLWDLITGKELRTFTGHGGSVFSVAISPDGRTAISGSVDSTLKLWDLDSGKELRTFAGHTQPVSSVVISSDGQLALSGSFDMTLKLWDLVSGKELRTFAGHTQPVWSVAISPNGQTAISGSTDTTLKLWDLGSGSAVHTFTGHTLVVDSVAISQDGRIALSGSADATLKVWDLANKRELRTLLGHTMGVNSVALSRDGRTALSGGWDNTLKLWDVASGKEVRTFIGHPEVVRSVTISPDGRTALSGGRDRTLKLWSLASEKELRTFSGHAYSVIRAAISPDGRTALSGGGDRLLKLWDLDTGKELRTFTGHTHAVTGVAFSRDGSTAFTGSADNTLKLWDLVSGNELRSVAGPTSIVAISPDGRTALSAGGQEKTLKLWDLNSGKELRVLTGHAYPANCVAISPNGRTALSGGGDKSLKLWDLDTGKELRSFTGHTQVVANVAIAPDGRTALSSCWSFTMKHWGLESGQELHTLTGHMDLISDVAIFPNSRTALSGSWDQTLKLWDLSSGKEIRTFTGHSRRVNCVAISPDGRMVLSGGDEKTLQLRDFTRGPAQREFEPKVAEAQEKLRQSASDPASLVILGEWYAFRGMDQWAVELLTKARERGAAVAPLTLARCYWNLDQLPEARKEFQIALDQSTDAAEQTYLSLCIAGIDTEPDR
jgi:WD40 repeat protein